MLTLRVATPEGKIIDQETSSVTIKTTNGVITVLPNHIPLLSIIKDGYVIVDGKQTNIKSAMVTVTAKSVVDVIVDQLD